MKIEIAYIHPTIPGTAHTDYAARFVASYLECPPGMDHSLTVVCNGGPPSVQSLLIFSQVPHTFYEHDNRGWDIGAYQSVAIDSDADILICFGESVHFHHPGWMKRMAKVWHSYGPGLYGGTVSNQVRPHVQTTGFWCPPSLIRAYPMRVESREERYAFEHGYGCITSRAIKSGMPVRLVTWTGDYGTEDWRTAPNGYWSGDQTGCLYFTNHADEYFVADSTEQQHRNLIANGYFN